MAQKNKTNLGYLGENFQYKLIHEFMENHTFFEDLSVIVDQNMFTDPNLKTFVGVMKNYFERESVVPSYEMMDIELRDISHSDKEIETYLAIIEKIKDTPSDGVERIRDLAEKFFRQQNIVKTANEILRIAGDGDSDKYDACVGLLNDAMAQGIHNDFGEGVFDHINETLSDDYRVPIPTGIGKIDEALDRIEDGTYGYCEETGEEIGIDRLMARPIATLCLEAQERHERKEKTYDDEA